MQKAIKKLKDEFIPKRIERAIETLEDKIKLGQVQTKSLLQKLLQPIEQKQIQTKNEIERIMSQIASIVAEVKEI